MDDIYFSDKKKKAERPTDNRSERFISDDFSDTDYYNEGFDTAFGRRNSQDTFSQREGFKVTLPDDEYMNSYPKSRTPQGRPVSHISENQREPMKKRPVSSDSEPLFSFDDNITGEGKRKEEVISSSFIHTPQARTPQRPPVQHRAPQGVPMNSRVPQGTKVNNPNHQKPVRMSRVGSAHHHPPKKPPVNKKKTALVAVVAVFAVFLVSLSGYGLYALSGINYDKTITENEYIDNGALTSSQDVINILFIGSDARSEVEGQRSDTLILFSIDKQNKKLKLTSFLRDSYVYIPSKKFSTKLNAAYSYGGAQLVMDTIEYNFGVDIDHYVRINFKAFRQLVDLLGGITIKDVSAAEAKYMREDLKLKKIKEGTNKMSGKTALWYCRMRYVDNDFKRTERQRKVISAIISKALKTNPFKLLTIVKNVLPNISTDIGSSELLGLAAGAALRYIYYDITQQQIPAEKTWTDARISGQLVLKLDIEKNSQILKEFLYEKDED